MKWFSLLFLVILFSFSSINHQGAGIHIADEASRIKITKAILDNLVKEDYESVRKDFHSSLRTALPVEKIAEVWQNVVASTGSFKEIVSTNAIVNQGYNQVKIRCRFENENATIETTFTEDDKVLGLYIKP